MIMEVTFPIIGETVEKVIEVAQRSTGVDIYDLQNRLDEAKQKLISLQSSPAIKESETIEVQNMLNDITGRLMARKIVMMAKCICWQICVEHFLK